MCPSRTTIANIIENKRKIILSIIFSQKIKANRKGIPVCPEKNKSLPVNIPLKASLVKKTESITARVGNGLMWVRLTKIDLMKVKRAILFIVKGI